MTFYEEIPFKLQVLIYLQMNFQKYAVYQWKLLLLLLCISGLRFLPLYLTFHFFLIVMRSVLFSYLVA